MMGTPKYIAPEQARNAKAADVRADIYSLGSTLFHMLAGKPPYEADDALAVVMMHMNDPVPDIREMNTEVSEACVKLLAKMMAKDPEERFQTAAELIVAIESG